MDQTTFKTANDLKPLMGAALAPKLVDVRRPEDVTEDPFRLPGSLRCAHSNICNWSRTLDPGYTVVVICQKGLKLSAGAAAQLRARGHVAHALEGGTLGWAMAGLPRIRDDTVAETYAFPTPCTPHAFLALWTILRWIAPDAAILWVPWDMVHDVADRFDAVPVPHDTSLAEILANAGLDWAPLRTFLSAAPTDGWAELLQAPQRLHVTPEAAAKAALPLIDAAWTALREDIT